MIIIDDLAQLERKVQQIKAKRDQAKGARDQLLRRLRKEYGCKTLKEAKALLLKLEDKERKAAVDYTEKKQGFEKKWSKVLKDSK